MFTIIYKPIQLSEFVGNQQIVQHFSEWLLNWDIHKSKKAHYFLEYAA